MTYPQKEIRIIDHGSHKKTITVELVIEEEFLYLTPAKMNPSLDFWQRLEEGQEVPMTLTLSGFWVQSVGTEPEFNIGPTKERYTTRVRLIGKTLEVK